MSGLFLIPVEESWLEKFENTVIEPIDINESNAPENFDGYEQVRIWGTTDEGNKRTHFEEMEQGDPVFFYNEGEIFALARVDETYESEELGELIWNSPSSRFIFTLTDYAEVEIPVHEINDLLGYSKNNVIMGFNRPSDEAISNLLKQFNSVEEAFQYYAPNGTTGTATDDSSGEEDGQTREHVEIQWHLIQLGLDQGYDVYVAKDECDEKYNGERLGEGCIDNLNLTGFSAATINIIEYVDVIWLDDEFIVEMFEVEHTTSVYSGILRMTDFVVKVPNLAVSMNIIAPDNKEDKVRRVMNRPSIQTVLSESEFSTLSYHSYEKVRDRQKTVEKAGPLQEPL